jgi:hypothetical protein
MTEAEWLACTDPWPMLQFLMVHKRSRRKYRLFGCACCRRIWHFLTHENSRRSIEFTEGWADGLVSDDEVYRACDAAYDAEYSHEDLGLPAPSAQHRSAAMAATCISRDISEVECEDAADDAAGYAAEAVAGGMEFRPGGGLTECGADHKALYAIECAEQCRLLRCIFGNPFQVISPDPSWGTPNAVILTRTMYETRDFTAMPLLADLLEETGCPKEVSAHCRGPGPHARGCWVVDLLLGRE